MRAGGLEQLLVAAEREPIRSVTSRPGVLAGVLDRVDDLAREALAPQLVVELERERDRAAGLGLDLVALERLHHQRHVVGLEVVLVAVEVDADPPLAASIAAATWAASSASTAAAACGICLPKRGPSAR